MQDVWEYKDPQYPGYPTEKNAAMLDMIIKTSSNEDSIVMDCFCGSGTTLRSAQQLQRNWIGIDCSKAAIDSTRRKIEEVNKSIYQHKLQYIDLTKSEEPCQKT